MYVHQGASANLQRSKPSRRRFIRPVSGADVREAWFVLVPEKQIEVQRRPVDGQYAETKTYSAGRLASEAVPGFELEIETFFKK